MERNEEQNARVQSEFLDRNLPQEITAEITLPDYRSEISRLLWVRPTFMPPVRFVGGGKADFSGTCRYDMLYTGPDGGLYSATEDGSYAFSVPLQLPSGFDNAGGVELSLEPAVDAVISRVTGPRKLSVRTRMHTRVCAFGEKDMGVRLCGDEGERERVLRLCDAVEGGRVLTGGQHTVELSEVVENEGEELRLVATHGAVLLSDVSVAPDAVQCRGEAVITLLYCKEGDEAVMPYTVLRKLPFTCEIPLDGATPDCEGRVSGAVSEIRAGVEEGKTLLDVRVALVAEAQTKECFALCRDLFLPGKEATPTYSEEHIFSAALCGNRHFSVSGEVNPAERGVPTEAAPLLAVADAEVKERGADGGQSVISGELVCHVLYCQGGEYGTAELSLPWRTVLEGAADDMMIAASAPLVRVTPTREGWRIDAEVQLSLRGVCRKTHRVLTEASFSAAEPKPRADVEICYPAAGETLWKVAKRYGISPDELAGANGLSGEDPNGAGTLAGVKYLMIP